MFDDSNEGHKGDESNERTEDDESNEGHKDDESNERQEDDESNEGHKDDESSESQEDDESNEGHKDDESSDEGQVNVYVFELSRSHVTPLVESGFLHGDVLVFCF